RLEPDGGRVCIPAHMRRHQIVRGLKTTATPLGDGAVSDRPFQAAGKPADIRRSVNIETHMAQVAGAAQVTSEESAVDDGSAADAGAEGEEEDIPETAGGADPR